MDLGSPWIRAKGGVPRGFVFGAGLLYHDTLQRNNPNLHLERRDNPIWCQDEFDKLSEDDELPVEEDHTCPMILLMAQGKRML